MLILHLAEEGKAVMLAECELPHYVPSCQDVKISIVGKGAARSQAYYCRGRDPGTSVDEGLERETALS